VPLKAVLLAVLVLPMPRGGWRASYYAMHEWIG
jgi:hypothetical protein